MSNTAWDLISYNQSQTFNENFKFYESSEALPVCNGYVMTKRNYQAGEEKLYYSNMRFYNREGLLVETPRFWKYLTF